MQLYLFTSSLDRGKATDALIEIKQASCSRHDFPRHSHEEFQISLMQAGYASHFYRGARTRVGPGNVTIFQAGEAHSAEASGLSRYHFLRQFEKFTGLPPHQYQIQLRIAKAKELLREGWEPALVASEVGFADQSHLYRYFKRLVGITPGQFIRAVRS